MPLKIWIWGLLLSVAVLFTATLWGIVQADKDIESALARTRNGYSIVTAVSKLNRLSTEIHAGGLRRIQSQWAVQIQLLRTVIGASGEDSVAIDQMTHDIDHVETTFNELIKIYLTEQSSPGEGDYRDAKFYRVNNLSILLYSLSSSADRLAARSFAQAHQVQETRSRFLLCLGLLWSVAVAIWAWVLWTQLTTPMRRLLKALKILGKGDLSCRVPVGGHNTEMNRLLESFNSMLDRLERLVFTRKQILAMTEQERRRISRELHDGVTQSLAAIRLGVKGLPENPSQEKANQLADLLSRTQSEIQAIVRDLRPVLLDEMGLIPALEWFSRQVDLDFHLSCHAGQNQIPEHLGIPIFRIVQEATNNAIRHGHATRVDVQLNIQNGDLDVTIEDDGNGFDQNKTRSGNGLVNLRERVESEGGDFSLDSSPGRGCCIIASFPLRK